MLLFSESFLVCCYVTGVVARELLCGSRSLLGGCQGVLSGFVM